jgi:hypothetical protein
MARSIRRAWNDGRGGGSDDDMLKRAQENIKEKQESARQNLLKLQGLEIRQLEGERTWIGKERERDVSAFNNKEIAGINQRYDRLVHRMERRNNTGLAKFARLFGGHKRQQRRIERINTERDGVVTERTRQHVRREGQRQRSLTERDVRVETDLQQAREKHSDAREQQRQQQTQGFDYSVKQEVNRLRRVQQPIPRM